jgi:leucyl/phenylalanyl-tRNA--protein transferase
MNVTKSIPSSLPQQEQQDASSYALQSSLQGRQRIISPELLLQAYRQGFFAMAVDPGRIEWFSPIQRGILLLEEFHIPHGLRRSLKAKKWKATVNKAFLEVILGCADRKETWIDKTIFASFFHLHKLGHAHSIEVWQDGELAGGLYGVSIGGVFFGESMFHRKTDGSKIALKVLVDTLRHNGFLLLDAQWTTPHLEQFGIKQIPRSDYLHLLENALNAPARFPQNGPLPVVVS